MSAVTKSIMQSLERVPKRHNRGRAAECKHQLNCPANDVTFEVNCPVADTLTFYKFKPQPFSICDETINAIEEEADAILEKYCIEQLSARMAIIRNFHSCGLLSGDLLTQGHGYLKARDFNGLSTWTNEIYDVAIQGLLNKVTHEVTSMIVTLPFGDEILADLQQRKIYCFNIEESGGSAKLHYSAMDFFSHYDADIDRMGDSLKRLYVMTISKLLLTGDGVWQEDIQSFGRWDFIAPNDEIELGQVQRFVEEFQSIEIEEAADFIDAHSSKCVQDFLGSIEESYFHSISDVIDNEDDGEFESYKENIEEGFKFLLAAFQSKSMGTREKVASWDELEEMMGRIKGNLSEGMSNSGLLLEGVIKNRHRFIGNDLPRDDVFSAVEETCPGMGVIICPFDEDTDAGKAMRVLSEEMWQQFMESGEAGDDWIINTDHPQWLDVVISRATSTALMMALIIGHTVILNKSE